MPVNLSEPEKLLVINGIQLAAGSAGIKKNGATDIVLIDICEGATCSAVFTQNKFRAAPVIISEKHLEATAPRLLLINSGNANAGTGESGYRDAIKTCELAADTADYTADQVLPFSTGVIGENLPVECFEKSLPKIADTLNADNWLLAANGIMTTDTIAKAVSHQVDIDGELVTITGIAKGSGMIKPNMATMLGYIATDARIEAKILSECLKTTVETSFNSITVDGDTSTNDSCVLIATGKSTAKEITSKDQNYDLFVAALDKVMKQLAQAIIRDAEGATKFIEVKITNAASYKDAKTIAYTVAHSPLVKTALFASDPNWGRILAAVGRAEIETLDIDLLTIHLDDVCIVRNGGRAKDYSESAGQSIMSNDEIVITIDLNSGSENAIVWTSDLSYDYVKINAEYRT